MISDFYEYCGLISKSGILSGSTLAGSKVNSNQLLYLGFDGVSPTLSDIPGLLWTSSQCLLIPYLFRSSQQIPQNYILRLKLNNMKLLFDIDDFESWSWIQEYLPVWTSRFRINRNTPFLCRLTFNSDLSPFRQVINFGFGI